MKQQITGRSNSKIPSYVDVYNQLYRDLASGVYPKGSLLTSENQLAAKYQVSRNTVRQALAVLSQDGYIYKKQGKGTFVSFDADQPRRPKIYNYLTESTREEIVHVEMDYNISPPTEIARNKMRLKEGVLVLASNNVYQTFKGPISHSFVQISMTYIEQRGIEPEAEQQLYELLNRRIYEDGHSAELSIQCVLADEPTSRYLEVEKRTPILYGEQIICDIENAPIARVKYHLMIDKYKVSFQL